MCKRTTYWVAALFLGVFLCQPALADERVTIDTFARAETDRTMQDYVDLGGFGTFYHTRVPSPLDKQSIVRQPAFSALNFLFPTLEAFGIRYFHAAIFVAPAIIGLLSDIRLPTGLTDITTCFLFIIPLQLI